MNQEFFKSNRQKFLEKVEDNSMSVFFSGNAVHKSADEDYGFEVDKNFYYLTGITQDQAVLVLIKKNHARKELLFIEKNDPVLSKWVGKKLEVEEARLLSGIDAISYTDSFKNAVFSSFNPSRKNTDNLGTLYLNLERRNSIGFSNPAFDFLKEFRDEYPEVKIANSYPLVIGQRMIKTASEIEAIKESVAVTRYALENMMKKLKPGLYEYQIEADFDYHIKTHGQRDTAFRTIAASGKNATILHYVANNSLLKAEDLILFDLGTRTEFYVSDISRTYPIGGTFSKRQKSVYEEVLDVNKKCIEYLKPGIRWSDFNQYAQKLLSESCRRLGILKDDKELVKFYWHNVGHFIGLDTHDPGLYDIPLEAGMVLTVEPGLYLEDEGIGVRIEDNVAITVDGCENLSKDIIKEVSEIEAFMNRK